MDDLVLECEKTFYRELYQFGPKNQWLVIDETTETLYVKKRLAVFDLEALRFLKEQENPHVPRVKAFYEEEGSLVLIEEYVQGETVFEAEHGGKLDEKMRQEIVLGVLDALTFLHSAKPPVIHRDIKPENIMISKDGVIKLVDYDAARVHHEGKSRDTVLLGTKGFAAPEQYGLAQSDVRTDLYGVGVLIRELFPGNSTYERIAWKATRMDPEDRYQSAEEMREAFLGVGEEASREEKAGSGDRTGKKKGKMLGLGWIVAIVLAVVLVQVLVAVAAFPGRRGSVAPEEDASEAQEKVSEEVSSQAGSETEERGASQQAASETEERRTSQQTASETEERRTSLRSVEETETVAALKIAEIIDSGFTSGKVDDTNARTSYAVQIYNPNPDKTLENVMLETTARAADGTILDFDRNKLPLLPAGDTMYFADEMFWEGEAAATLEFVIASQQEYKGATETIARSEDFVFNNTVMHDSSGNMAKFNGEIENRSAADLEDARIVIVFRKDGQIKGGTSGLTRQLMSGETQTFEVLSYVRLGDGVTFECYGAMW